MANPTNGQVRIDERLTNIAVAFTQDASEFIADRVFPSVPVGAQTGKYAVYDRADLARDDFQLRADATQSAGTGWGLTDDSYSCDVWALHKDIGRQLRANERPPIDLDRDATEYLTEKGLIRRDKSWVESYFVTGVWGRDLDAGSGFTAWDAGGSTPIQDLENERIIQKKRSGRFPNKLVLGAEVWTVIKNHSDFIDRVKYSGAMNPAQFTPQALAALLELDEVLITSGVETFTEKGDPDPTYSFLAGNNALLCYAAPRPSLLVPSAGYTFPWQGLKGLNGGSGTGDLTIVHIPMDQLGIGTVRVEAEMAYDMKLVAADCGSFFEDCVTELDA